MGVPNRTEASRHGSLAEAIEAATEAVDPRLRHPQTTLVVTHPIELGPSVLEVPSQVALAIEPGGCIKIRENQTLAIAGPIDAGFYPIFDCPGRFAPHRVVLEGNRFIERVVPQWWGATGGDTDDTDAILYAIDALTSRVPGRHRIGGTVFFPLGCYHIRPDAIDVRACR